MHTSDLDDHNAPVEWSLIGGALGLAVLGASLLFWHMRVIDVPSLACVAEPIPQLTRVAYGASGWISRLGPILGLFAAPWIVLFAVIAAVAIAGGNARRRVGRLVAALAIGTALLAVGASAVLAYTMLSAEHLSVRREARCEP